MAAGPDGRVWIAWDRYNTNYDVYCRSFAPGGGLRPGARWPQSPRFEGARERWRWMRANRPWVAWETGGVNWGKDLGAALGAKSPGTPLGGPRQIEVACRDGA